MVLLALSCTQVPLKDEILYGNKGMVGAVEFHTLSTTTRDVSFEEWMQMLKNKPLICSSADTFGDIKALVEKLCSVCNCCTAETKAKVEEFFVTIKKVSGK